MKPAARHHMSDLGRRVEARRTDLGLSREEVAARAGSTPGYIGLLEERLPTPGIEFLVRLAHALDTTVEDLTGYGADVAPGSARAGYQARMDAIDEAECWDLLGDHGVGRVAVTAPDGPEIFPMNYQVVGREMVFLTAADTPLARAAAVGATAAFEADRLDDAFSQGWSVLLVGPVRAVSDPATAETLRDTAYSTPWAGDERGTVVMLFPHRVTGRRVLVPGAPGTGP